MSEIRIREHTATHYCLVSLNAGEVSLDDELCIEKLDGSVIETTVEEYLTETLMPFSSVYSAIRDADWKEAWEEMGADSGYSDYVPTPESQQNWQDIETMAHQLGIGSQILLKFVANTLPGLNLHDFEVEWEDEADEHCRTFLLYSPE